MSFFSFGSGGFWTGRWFLPIGWLCNYLFIRLNHFYRLVMPFTSSTGWLHLQSVHSAMFILVSSIRRPLNRFIVSSNRFIICPVSPTGSLTSSTGSWFQSFQPVGCSLNVLSTGWLPLSFQPVGCSFNRLKVSGGLPSWNVRSPFNWFMGFSYRLKGLADLIFLNETPSFWGLLGGILDINQGRFKPLKLP